MNLWTPLIELGLNKAACGDIVLRAGIEVPEVYRLGLRNANCIPCCKGQSGTGTDRVLFPDEFDRMAKLEREMDVAINKTYSAPGREGERVRVFLDELDPDAGNYEQSPRSRWAPVRRARGTVLTRICEAHDPACVFCTIEYRPAMFADVLTANDHGYLYRDGYPVTEGHMLVIPWEHRTSFFDMTRQELRSLYRLLDLARMLAQEKDDTVVGFNLGINEGKAAGQTIEHCHVHLIPRRTGDTEDPTGGVRNVIAGKGRYGA